MADSLEQARARMIEKRFGGNNQGASTGGGGSVRRKKKTAHKAATNDDKKLKTTLKKLGVSPIPGIEEVNLFKDDGNVIHFVNPKVQASIQSNTYVVSGNSETKPLQDLLPGIISQIGPDNVNSLKQLAEAYAAAANNAGASEGASSATNEEEMPTLVENFEEVSNK